MRDEIKRKIVTGLVIGGMMAINVCPTYANTKTFTKVFVSGSSYADPESPTVEANKDSDHSYVEIKVTKMYKDNGKSSRYKYSKAKLYGWDTKKKKNVRCVKNSDFPKTLKKGKKVKFSLLADYQRVGKTIKYCAKGNKPQLECKISGKMWLDQE